MSDEIRKLSEDFSEMKGDIKVLNTKVDGMSIAVQNLSDGIGAKVLDHSEKLIRFEEKFYTTESTLSRIYAKIDGHIKNHWHFVAIIVAILTILSITIKLLDK